MSNKHFHKLVGFRRTVKAPRASQRRNSGERRPARTQCDTTTCTAANSSPRHRPDVVILFQSKRFIKENSRISCLIVKISNSPTSELSEYFNYYCCTARTVLDMVVQRAYLSSLLQ